MTDNKTPASDAAVPAGHATDAMIRAANEATENGGGFREVWSAMLAAAPKVASHPDDEAVDRFAARMKAKLAAARDKGRGGWDDPAQCSTDYLRLLLHEHVAKGDPVDVANFCMMLDHYGASTAPKVASDTALPNSWTNTPEAEREQAMLLAEVELHLQQCRVFITTREKMHPCGVDLHDELQAKVTAALDAIGREKSRG